MIYLILVPQKSGHPQIFGFTVQATVFDWSRRRIEAMRSRSSLDERVSCRKMRTIELDRIAACLKALNQRIVPVVEDCESLKGEVLDWLDLWARADDAN